MVVGLRSILGPMSEAMAIVQIHNTLTHIITSLMHTDSYGFCNGSASVSQTEQLNTIHVLIIILYCVYESKPDRIMP